MDVQKDSQKQEALRKENREQESVPNDSDKQKGVSNDGGTEENLHRKHRERMRQRFFQTGLDSFAEHEALELLLYFSIPQKDTNELAHRLIVRFGSLDRVLSASRQELMEVNGIGENSAALLTLIPQLCRKVHLLEAEIILDSMDKIGLYLLRCFENAGNEQVHLLCLNRTNRLLACLCVQEGGLCGADVNVREVVKHALLTSAASVVLAHNHPSGSPLPSTSDYTATDRVREALNAVGIPLLDHFIIAGEDYVSLRESGFL